MNFHLMSFKVLRIFLSKKMSWINDLKVQLLTDEMMTAVKVYWSQYFCLETILVTASKYSYTCCPSLHTMLQSQGCGFRAGGQKGGGKEGGREGGRKKERQVVALNSLLKKMELNMFFFRLD